MTAISSSEKIPKRIMVLGDSNALRSDGGSACWPTLLEDKEPVHLKVFNESCNGRTTQYDTGERNALSVIKDKLAARMPLDYVIIMLGTNDVKSRYGPPSAADIASGMRRILDLIVDRGNGVEPILTTPPPLGNVTCGDLAGAQSRIPSVATEYRSLAMERDIRLIDLNAVLDNRTDLEPDKVHLNAVGREKIADVVWATLKDVVLPAKPTQFGGLRDMEKKF